MLASVYPLSTRRGNHVLNMGDKNAFAQNGRLGQSLPGTHEMGDQPRVYERRGFNSSASTPPIPTKVHWEPLSPEAAWTTVHLAWPISLGFSKREVAAQVGETTSWVHKRTAKLRDELERLSG
jgi:hypothetical protein